MAPRIDEYDVFKIPHSRMMQLVNSCNKKLNVTDFANNDQLLVLLTSLHTVFKEFKSHEDIENEHIMIKLKSKLKAMAIYNSAVCNCHKDDEFTPLIQLVEMGYLLINKAKTTSERIGFGVKLRKALSQFTQRFVPHMKEEEEVFQPLLMQHFTQAELTEMKHLVIKLHMQKRKQYAAASAAVATAATRESNATLHARATFECMEQQLAKSLSILNGLEEELQNASGAADGSGAAAGSDSGVGLVNKLPAEILLNVMARLPLADRLRAARVCKRWNRLVYDQSNWKALVLADWQDNIKHRESVAQERTGGGYKDIEYIDDSDEEYDDESEIKDREVKTIHFWVKNLLPRVGSYLNQLDLRSCKSLNNNLARRILQLCPNLTSLDLSYTNIGDNAFRGVHLNKLQCFNCEGCSKLSDNAFKHLLLAQIALNQKAAAAARAAAEHTSCCQEQHSTSGCRTARTEAADSCTNCVHAYSIEETVCARPSQQQQQQQQQQQPSCLVDQSATSQFNSLSSINLSGCLSITDYGLSYIASKYDLTNLEYLNLSGCLNLTALGLHLFVETSHSLAGENLFYCDNITEGPMRESANACANLECAKKFCCRSGSG